MLIEKENFINNEFCNYLIKHHNITPHDSTHRNTSIIECEIQSSRGNFAFKLLLKKLIFFADNIMKDTFIDYSQIVKWPSGESIGEHVDFDRHTFTSVLYLNDEYEGGHTVVGDKIIKPKKGKIILFEGSKIKHEVTPVTFGTRYTNATWYITKTEQEVIE